MEVGYLKNLARLGRNKVTPVDVSGGSSPHKGNKLHGGQRVIDLRIGTDASALFELQKNTEQKRSNGYQLSGISSSPAPRQSSTDLFRVL